MVRRASSAFELAIRLTPRGDDARARAQSLCQLHGHGGPLTKGANENQLLHTVYAGRLPV